MTHPFAILGVGPDANDEEIRQAYLRLVREFPPERDPQRFQVVREAYDAVENQRKRLAYRLFATPEVDLTPLLLACLQGGKSQRPGTNDWLELLRKELKEHRFIGDS
ncbi:MAG: DnaJ domain-containing protein [Magnetococcales bacterium]|nr:DnaJ domain-containing protein [Magnetococcales bacterium]